MTRNTIVMDDSSIPRILAILESITRFLILSDLIIVFEMFYLFLIPFCR